MRKKEPDEDASRSRESTEWFRSLDPSRLREWAEWIKTSVWRNTHENYLRLNEELIRRVDTLTRRVEQCEAQVAIIRGYYLRDATAAARLPDSVNVESIETDIISRYGQLKQSVRTLVFRVCQQGSDDLPPRKGHELHSLRAAIAAAVARMTLGRQQADLIDREELVRLELDECGVSGRNVNTLTATIWSDADRISIETQAHAFLDRLGRTQDRVWTFTDWSASEFIPSRHTVTELAPLGSDEAGVRIVRVIFPGLAIEGRQDPAVKAEVLTPIGID